MKRRNLSLFAIYFVYFLDYFGIAVIFPIFSPLILKGTYGLLAPSTPLHAKLIYLAILITAFPLAQIIGAPLFGRVADKKGRKIAFHFTLLGEATGYALTALALIFRSFSFLLLSRLFTGFFAGNLAVCLSAIADRSSDPERRSRYFGYLATAGGMSFILAIVIGGEFSDSNLNPIFNPTIPFWILVGITLFNLLFVKVFYHEVQHQQKRKETTFFTLFKIPILKHYYAIFFFFMLAWMPSNQFLSAFLIENFSSSKQTIVYTFLAAGALWSLTNAYINRLLIQAFSSKKILYSSLFLCAVSFFISAIANQLYLFVLFFELAAVFASLSWTNCLALVSLKATSENQGYILGWNQGLGALAMVIAPFACAYIGSFGTRAIYIFISASIFISFIIMNFKKLVYKQNKF